jgi:ribosomal protein S12 methylthiotransferase
MYVMNIDWKSMSIQNQSIHFVSLGCPKNRIDTETMLANLPRNQYTITANAEDADVVVVNTCSFIDSAKQESIDTILEMADLKENAKLKKLIVSGCLSQRYSKELATELPEVDHFIGTNDLDEVRRILENKSTDRVLVGNPDRKNFNWEMPRTNTMAKHSAYLKIAEGCSNTCAFCIIPTLRGPQRSRSIESIVKEAEELGQAGVLEINLIAQDLTAYGYDLQPRSSLTQLLKELVKVPKIRWIRLFYAYPRSFPDGLVDIIANEHKIVPYLDMPLQHISDPVLRNMRRGTNEATVRKRVAQLRERIPNLTLRTTFIVGYPGETEDDHKKLIDFVQETKFERMGAFPFSREEGTPSYDLPDQIDDETKERRVDELMFVQRDISREHNEKLIGKEVDVLIERVSPESDLAYIGRTSGQAPDIDGVTYIGLHDDIQIGKIVKAVITQATDYDLAADYLD